MNPYLHKYAKRLRLIRERPHPDLGLVVVIPSACEAHLDSALNALYSCELPDCAVEIIIVVNGAENTGPECSARNKKSLELCERWKQQHDRPEFKVFAIAELELPPRRAGVGLARKIGMDEAVRRFEDLNRHEGIIACFDADSTCAPNYLRALHWHFHEHPKTPGCSIRFAHPTFGTEYSPHHYLGISYYELHLRYYNQALRACGFPHAYHTVGSSMAVRSSAYQKQGGMNTRKAGEDFYFLHKIIALGHFTELNDTLIIPSARSSDRVPFGTGRSIGDFIKKGQSSFFTYNLQAFKYLHLFFKQLPEFYILEEAKLEKLGGVLPYILLDFLSAYFFEERIAEIKANSRGFHSFEKRFYRWFNAFMVLKFVHFVRDNAHPNTRVELAALDFLRQTGYPDTDKIRSLSELLSTLRMIDQWPAERQLRFVH